MNTELHPASPAASDRQGWTAAAELLRTAAGDVPFDRQLSHLDWTLRQTRALLKAICVVLRNNPDEINEVEVLDLVESARDRLMSVGDDPLAFVEGFSTGAHQVVAEQAQRISELSCAITHPGAAVSSEVVASAFREALQSVMAMDAGDTDVPQKYATGCQSETEDKPTRPSKRKAAAEGGV